MNCTRIDFGSAPWVTLADGAREKRVAFDGCAMRLLELQPPFREEDWCAKAHRGYVVDGAFDLEFRDRIESLRAGDGLHVESGPGQEHKAIVVGRVLLFLIE
ncbi:MAG: hypothetical protein KDA42_00715 [Planctomycetales bacterium]|nr:hypothetical protein [Planctomycetales bacterium]